MTQQQRTTYLLGRCMVQANKDHPHIREMIPVKGCPPSREELVRALQRAGIEVNEKFFENIDLAPGYYLKRYAGSPEFEEALFQVSDLECRGGSRTALTRIAPTRTAQYKKTTVN